MEDISETNTKVLSRELFLGVVTLKTPTQKNHYLRNMGVHTFSQICSDLKSSTEQSMESMVALPRS